MGFDLSKARDDARVLDPDAASLDRRIPGVTASAAGADGTGARLNGPGGTPGAYSAAGMLASFAPPTRLDSPFLRAFAGIPAPDTRLGAIRPGEAYGRTVSAFADNSMLEPLAKFGSLAESQVSAAFNASTARSIAGSLRSLGSPLPSGMLPEIRLPTRFSRP